MRLSLVLSGLLSVVSSHFCFSVMRQRALAVGNQGEPFARDPKRTPGLVLRFIAAGPAYVWSRVASSVHKRRLEFVA